MNRKECTSRCYAVALLTALLLAMLALSGCSNTQVAKAEHVKRGESVLSLARFYMSIKDEGKAEETFKQAIALNESSSMAHSEYGKFLVQAGRNDQAESEFRRAIEVEPTNRDARFIIASFYLV